LAARPSAGAGWLAAPWLAAQVLPAASWLATVRSRLPGLAGLGAADHVALTFDDGPDRRGTPAILARLAELGWRATFFLVGEQARRNPGLVRELVAAGHELGLHGDEHRLLLARGPLATYRDLRAGLDTLGALTDTPVRWYRPAYGVLTGAALFAVHRLRLRPVLWSAWGRDWRAGATPAGVLAELRAGRLAGGTLLLHDADSYASAGSWRVTAAVLPMLAEELAARGLVAGPLAEHGAAGAYPALDRTATSAG
jgi:peptidoglycan/xylan/chitin deacetylase (PgdA/CDA1 family)